MLHPRLGSTHPESALHSYFSIVPFPCVLPTTSCSQVQISQGLSVKKTTGLSPRVGCARRQQLDELSFTRTTARQMCDSHPNRPMPSLQSLLHTYHNRSRYLPTISDNMQCPYRLGPCLQASQARDCCQAAPSPCAATRTYMYCAAARGMRWRRATITPDQTNRFANKSRRIPTLPWAQRLSSPPIFENHPRT